MEVKDLRPVRVRAGNQILYVPTEISFCGGFHIERWVLPLTVVEQIFQASSICLYRSRAQLPVGLQLEPFVC